MHSTQTCNIVKGRVQAHTQSKRVQALVILPTKAVRLTAAELAAEASSGEPAPAVSLQGQAENSPQNLRGSGSPFNITRGVHIPMAPVHRGRELERIDLDRRPAAAGRLPLRTA